jgi:hypothetical protein
MRRALALLLAACAVPAAAQGVVVDERVVTGRSGPIGYAELYGEPLNASLESLARLLGELNFRAVRSTGRLERTRDGSYFTLTDGLDAVLLVPVEEIVVHDLMRYAGTRVEVVGLARELIERQTRGDCIVDGPETIESRCRDWHLPALPDRLGRADWPRNSVTFWTLSDATPFERKRRPGDGGLTISDVLADLERLVGQQVELFGRFRGANLFGDLPEETRQKASDWVIEQDGAALWVTGKKPEGRGWSLDPRSKGESRWWIQVTGKLELRDGIVVLDAKTLELRRPPG